MTRAARYDFERLSFMVAAETADRLDRSCAALEMARGAFVIEAVRTACTRRESGLDPFDREAVPT